jgi:hypothetical protein
MFFERESIEMSDEQFIQLKCAVLNLGRHKFL